LKSTKVLKRFSGDAGYRKTTVEFVENILNRRIDISIKNKDRLEIIDVNPKIMRDMFRKYA